MFKDIIKLKLKAGNGGNGIASFRKEKFIVNGGPDGGNGGNGGSILLVGDSGLNNLYRLTSINIIRAEDGKPGQSSNKYGRAGEDYIIKVPFGVIVKDVNNRYIGEITHENDTLVVCHGGRGGRGNKSFQSNRNQAPDFAEPGRLGEEKEVILELKTISNVGLLGLPNVGKSTLLKQITRATPKIANYPFTTISPNLGVLNIYDKDITIADIPGIIEGASNGLGLGFKFLRHIERCQIFIFVIDSSSENPFNDFNILINELKMYNEGLLQRPYFIYLNKFDLIQDDDIKIKEITQKFKKLDYIIGSNFDNETYKLLSKKIYEKYIDAPKIILNNDITKETIKQKDKLFHILKTENIFKVTGDIIYNLFHRVDFNKPEQVLRFSYQLRSLGVEQALIDAGAKDGDIIDIEGYEFIFEI